MKAGRAQELKGLQSTRSKVEKKLLDVRVERVAIEGKICGLSKQLKEINSKIALFTAKDLTVSEHALLRLLERSHGTPVRDAEQRLLEELGSVANLDNGDYPVSNGLKAIVRNNIVITVR